MGEVTGNSRGSTERTAYEIGVLDWLVRLIGRTSLVGEEGLNGGGGLEAGSVFVGRGLEPDSEALGGTGEAAPDTTTAPWIMTVSSGVSTSTSSASTSITVRDPRRAESDSLTRLDGRPVGDS